MQALKLKKQNIWTTARIVLALSLIGFVLTQTEIEVLISIWQDISLPWMMLSILAFWSITVATTYRYWVLIGKTILFRQTMGLVIVQMLVGNFVANAAGAASYVALLRGRYQVQIHVGLASIVLSRFGDLAIFGFALGAATWMLWEQLAALQWVTLVVLATIYGILATVLMVLFWRMPFLSLLARLLDWSKISRLSIVQRGMDLLKELALQNPPRIRHWLFKFLLHSGIIVCCNFVFTFANVRMFNLPIGFWEVLYMMALIQLLAVIPIQVFGGLGVYEVTAAYLYEIFGVGQTLLFPVTVASRIYLYLLSITLLLYLPFDRHTEISNAKELSSANTDAATIGS